MLNQDPIKLVCHAYVPEDDELNGIPVVVLAARRDYDSRLQCERIGVNG